MMVVHTYQVEKEITKFKYRNSTTPRGPTICIQSSNVLSLKRVATATTTAITNQFGVPVEAHHVSSQERGTRHRCN